MQQTPIRELTQKYNHKEILSRCKDLFYQKSLSKVTSDEISQKCGYSKKTIYAYFSSKEQIWEEISTQCADKFFADMQQQSFDSFLSFIEYVYAYKLLNMKDYYYIAIKNYKKDSEEDYFAFSQRFKPMINILVEKCSFIYTSIDIPLLLWNSIVYATENNMQLHVLKDFINGKCFT